MRFAMFGAGGVGAVFGAQLLRGGQEVAFVARGPHLVAMREQGLKLVADGEETVLAPVEASDDPAALGPADVVFLCVKLWDTAEAARACAPLVGDGTVVISLQNGVDAEPLLARELGAGHVMGGVSQVSAVIDAPGVVRQTGAMSKLLLGELDGSRSARAERILEALTGAGVDAEIPVDINAAIWSKFAMLASFAAVTAATRCRAGAVRADADTRALFQGAMEEVAALAAAEGVALPEGVIDERMAFLDRLPPQMTASMHEDLERGNRLELDWLSGAVVRMAGRHGLAVPVHRTLYAVLKPWKDGR